MVSSKCRSSVCMVAIRQVLQLPPNESLRIVVINEFLYGMCVLFPCSLSCSATITCSKNVNDLFIYFASLKIYPSTLDLVTLSLPARSTRCNLDVLMISEVMSLPSKAIVKIQWLLDEAWFIGVLETYRTKFPIVNKSIPSCSFCTWWIDRFRRCKFPQSSS